MKKFLLLFLSLFITTIAIAKQDSKAPDRADSTMDYKELDQKVYQQPLPKTLYYPPYLGTKGYRSSSVMLGSGDRTPGFGVLTEYNFNRIGIGAAASWNPSTDTHQNAQYFFNMYANYYWLPFAISPYFLLGMGFAANATHVVGAIGGAGVEALLYRGFTISIGYTYHSTVVRGFPGVSLGMAF